jgi:MATE family multidrug resistance protein
MTGPTSTSLRAAASPAGLTHRAVLALAGPAMLANLSGPLIGVVDTAVVGQIPSPAHIGAVAIGSLIFTFVFWAFAFLRMSTTGLTAQAVGAQDATEVAASLARALLVAAGIGLAIVVLQWPIREIAFALIGASAEVEELARGYFDIRVWAAPATLATYALFGWLIGIGRTGLALVMTLSLNVTNVVLDVVLALNLGWGVRGVATGAMSAEVTAALIGGALAWRQLKQNGARPPFALLLDAVKLRRLFALNIDIMVRTLALIAIFVWFTAIGARYGDATLAANALLMTSASVVIAYLDGIAFATEALVGRAIGAAHRAGMLEAVRISTYWAAALAAVSAVALYALGPSLIDLLTVDPMVRAGAREYLPWAAAVPAVGVWAFQLDGVFIGATRTADMRTAALAALALYLAAWWLLRPFGNHGLWAAMTVGYAARALTLLRYYPALVRAVPA